MTLCKHGHERTPKNSRKSDGACKQCIAISGEKYRASHPDYVERNRLYMRERNKTGAVRTPNYKFKVTKKMLLSYAGMLQKDVAALIGKSYSYIRFLVTHYGIRDRFPQTKEAHKIAYHGYADNN